MEHTFCKKHDLSLLKHICFRPVKGGNGSLSWCGFEERCLKYGPIRVTTASKDGATRIDLYLQYNPWQLSHEKNNQKVFKYCLFCGKQMFSEEEWEADNTKTNGLLLGDRSCQGCNSPPCLANLQNLTEKMHLFYDELFFAPPDNQFIKEGNLIHVDHYGYVKVEGP